MTSPPTSKNTVLDDPTNVYWKDATKTQIAPDWAQDINAFENEILLKKQGRLEDKVFAESRLRRGAYGQRYDNGRRNDGTLDRPIPFPDQNLTKGVGTFWHAPGMLRIKIPYGAFTVRQMGVLADLAEEYSDSILHVTTRQDFQLHYIHIEDTPSIFRRLAAVGITTREACGNSVRNVTACPFSGVCKTEIFDVSPYARALAFFLLGHPDTQDFGRKFKYAFSGCETEPCALVNLHDMGFIAAKKIVEGVEKRGFRAYVGGGLGALPYQAKLYEEFLPEEELLPTAQAVSRIFARHGEKLKRNRARIKFLVSDWGIEKFKAAVLEERAKLATDPRWTAFLNDLHVTDDKPLRPKGNRTDAEKRAATDADFSIWLKNNVKEQSQQGYVLVTLALPLGDLSSLQMRALAKIAARYVGDTVRATVDQNIVLRWVSASDLCALYDELKAHYLVQPYARSIVDVTACPGTDTCKLGISSSRGLANELHKRLAEKSARLDQAIKDLSIKISGCFNSCGQHHIADIGFYGVGRKVGDYMVPHFQVVLGGELGNNAAAYGQAIVAVPSKAVPAVIDALADAYVKGRTQKESFAGFVNRTGKAKLKMLLDPFTRVPSHDADPSFYKDWGDVREYSKKDIGVGECAGEVVSLVDFGLAAADRLHFEALVALDGGDEKSATDKGLKAMLTAAQALIKAQNPDISDDKNEIAKVFREKFYDTKLIFDPYQADKFANYFWRALETDFSSLRNDQVRRFIDEAQLFIEAAYACNLRITMGPGVGANTPVV